MQNAINAAIGVTASIVPGTGEFGLIAEALYTTQMMSLPQWAG